MAAVVWYKIPMTFDGTPNAIGKAEAEPRPTTSQPLLDLTFHKSSSELFIAYDSSHLVLLIRDGVRAFTQNRFEI